MRAVTLFMLLLAIGPVAAAPAPPASGPAVPSIAIVAADPYISVLLTVIEKIVSQYVRPIQREDLLFAALAGLYEEAHLPVPRSLQKECKRIARAVGPRAAEVDEGVPTEPAVNELKELIRRVVNEVAAADTRPGRHAPVANRLPVLPDARVRQWIVVSARAMTRLLDPFSTVFTAEDFQKQFGEDDGNARLGLEPRAGTGVGPIVIGEVQPGGPAQRAGLRPGDTITHLDGKQIDNPADALEKLRGQASHPQSLLPGEQAMSELPKALVLTCRRAGKKDPLTVELLPEAFHAETVFGVSRREDNAWNFFMDRPRGLAHVRLGPVAKHTPAELRAALAKLQAESLRGLVLDLRWAPGGFLKEATECVGLFLGEAIVATVKSRAQPDTNFRCSGDGKFTDFPIVVLINGDTSGGAELIAAALQDHRRAVLVGQRTRGKGSIQNGIFLGFDGIGMKLTNGTFHRPNGKNLHRFPDSKLTDDWGVRPDAGREFRTSADLNRMLAEAWQAQTLRPGSSRERLPLDDPNNDPAALAALEVLQERLAKSNAR